MQGATLRALAAALAGLRTAAGLLACAAAHSMMRRQYSQCCQSSVLAMLGLEDLLASHTSYCVALQRGMQALPLLAAAAVGMLANQT